MKLGMQIDWKAEPPMREKALFILIAAMLIIPLARGFWFPMEINIDKSHQDLKNIETQIQTIEKMLEMTSKEMSLNQKMIEQRVQASDRIGRILSRQTGDRNQEVANAINALSSRELTFYLRLMDVAVGEMFTTESFTAIPIDVTLEGGYGAVERYIGNVEKMDRPFQIRKIKLLKTSGNTGTIEARLTIYVYLSGGAKPA